MMQKKLLGIDSLHLIGALMALALAAQTGCTPVKRPPASVSATPQAPAAPTERLPEERPPGLIVTEIEGSKEPERLYSFSLRDAEIREVLMAIAKQTSFNIVVDPKVKGSVTVDLKNVTLSEALDTLTDLLELSYTIKRNIIRVFEPVPETRIFSLQYVNLRRIGASATMAQIGTSGVGAGTTGAVGTTGATGVTGVSGATGGTAGQTSVTTTTSTDLWKDLEEGVKKILSPRGQLVIDKQSANLLVTDLPKFLDRVGSFLESVEGAVQRQVLIEAKVIEVTLTGQYRFGIDWGAIARAGVFQGASTASAARILGQALAPTPNTRGFQIGVTSANFAALLDVLNTQGELNVLSSPKLATLSNQTAVIRAGTDQVFFETRIQETPSLTGTQTTRTITPRTVTIGVVLGITPQIAPDGAVVLHVRPTVTEKRGDAVSALGDSFPILDVREADMIVRAKEGQVVVIGGLMQDKKSEDERKVPILGDLPGVGVLFRAPTQEVRKTELVVLLSPTVLVGKKVDEVTSRELERVNKRMGSSPW
jgi:MSHA type pilus biogenesis protein MshL